MILKTFSIILLSFFLELSLIAQTYWTQQTSAIGKYFWSIKAVDLNVGWACGDSGIVFRTTNGGTNWNLTSAPTDILRCYCIEAINAETAWVTASNFTGGNTAIFKTIDGGISWQTKYSSNEPESFYNAVKFFDKDNGIFYGDPENGYFAIYTTENGGETWIRTDSSKIPTPGNKEYGVTDNLAISGNNAWFGTQGYQGRNARLFYSNDRGKTWSAIIIEGVSSINNISFSDELNGIIVCENNKVGYTHDGGLTWTFPSTIKILGNSASFATSSSFILVGDAWTYVSKDGGATWNEIEANFAHWFKSVSFSNSSNGWALATFGEIFKWVGGSLPDLPVSVKDEFENNILFEFELKQNYPNPFNPTTTIEYTIPERTNATLKVFDLLGREITTLFNEEKTPGNYKVEFNGSSLPNGVYFYRLDTGKKAQTKKLILVK